MNFRSQVPPFFRTLFCGALAVAAILAEANPIVSTVSKSLGGGVFEYEIRFHDDGFAGLVEGADFGFIDGEFDEILMEAPEGWRTYLTNSMLNVVYTNTAPVAPQTLIVRARSVHPYVCVKRAVYTYVVRPDPFLFPIGGYQYWDCLTPCATPPEDPAPSVLQYVNGDFDPNVRVLGIHALNGGLASVHYVCSGKYTLLLRESRDGKTWTDVSYILANPSIPIWTGNLTGKGPLFRLDYISRYHRPDLLD